MPIKTFAVFLALALVSVVQAAKCPDSEMLKLTPIASDAHVGQCTKDSGFNLIPPSSLSNDVQTTKMCKSSSCRALVDAVKAVNPLNCDLTVLEVTLNVGQLVDSFYGTCTRVLSSSRAAAYPPCSW